MENLHYSLQDVKSLSKEQFKVKLGNMKIGKRELDEQYREYEDERRNKINEILKVSIMSNLFPHHSLLSLTRLQERKNVVKETQQYSRSNGTNTPANFMVSKSLSYLKTNVTRNDIQSIKSKREYDMKRVLNHQLAENEMRKITQMKYELLK